MQASVKIPLKHKTEYLTIQKLIGIRNSRVMINGLYLALLIVILWIGILAVLARPMSKTKNFSLYGPMLMIKTSKDRKILDRVAQRFPAIGFSKVSVAVFLIWGLLSLAFLIYEAYLVTQIRVVASPPLNEYLVIPGLNPAIPIFYGTFALFIGVVIHELMHGIVARKHNIKVNSVGALFFVVPIGAFVEPDQEEIEKTDPVVRRRIFASGAGVNILITVVALFIVIGIMMPAAQPAHQGFYVNSVDSNYVGAGQFSLGNEIIAVNGQTGNAFANLEYNSTFVPGTLVHLTLYDGKTTGNITAPAGLVIDGVSSGYPAEKANISTGSIFYSLDSKIIYNQTSLDTILENILPGTQVNLTMITYNSGGYSNPQYVTHSLVTASKYDYYASSYPSLNSPAYRNQSFLGVQASYMGILGAPLSDMKDVVFGYTMFSDFPTGLFQTLALPFQGLSPVPGNMASLFNVPGASWLFWGTMNTMFWLFYINLLLALLNTLPAAILDGGQFFKDTMKIASRRKPFRALESDRRINGIANFLTFLVLFILLFLVIAPRVL